jgi:hypothetical protein
LEHAGTPLRSNTINITSMSAGCKARLQKGYRIVTRRTIDIEFTSSCQSSSAKI